MPLQEELLAVVQLGLQGEAIVAATLEALAGEALLPFDAEACQEVLLQMDRRNVLEEVEVLAIDSLMLGDTGPLLLIVTVMVVVTGITF